jgi:hypothetical protein
MLPLQILMFSYGSGAAGSMFMLRGRRSGNPRFNLDLLSRKVRHLCCMESTSVCKVQFTYKRNHRLLDIGTGHTS